MDELTRRLSQKIDKLSQTVVEQAEEIKKLSEQQTEELTLEKVLELFRGKGTKPTTETKALFDKIASLEKRVNKIERRAERKTTRKTAEKPPRKAATKKAK